MCEFAQSPALGLLSVSKLQPKEPPGIQQQDDRPSMAPGGESLVKTATGATPAAGLVTDMATSAWKMLMGTVWDISVLTPAVSSDDVHKSAHLQYNGSCIELTTAVLSSDIQDN